jgi:4-amino-4-deoxy-L-arabinose transferase-like glycosyltransferase
VRGQLKRLLLSTSFIVVAAFAVRMLCLYYDFRHFREAFVQDDLQFGAELGSVAASIASGHGFSSPMRLVPSGPTAIFAPIYPYLLAGLFKLCGVFTYSSSLVIRTIQCAFSAFTCWPIYSIGKRVFGKNIAKAAAWAWVLFPAAIYFAVEWVWDTSLVALWMALVVAATLELRGSDRTARWIGYGALWGIGAMINPSLLATLPFLALWAIWPLRGRLLHAAKLSIASALVFLACITPWTVRNYLVFHRFIPLRSNFGLELWLYNHPGPLDRSFHPVDYQPELDKYVRMTEVPYMQEKEREAFAFFRTHPADAARSTLHRFVQIWLGVSESPADLWHTIPFYLKCFIAANCAFSLFALLGALLAFRLENPAAFPLAIVLLVYPIVFYITHAELRYRFPIDPVMLLFAVHALAYPLSRLVAQRHALAAALTPGTDQSLS